MKIISRRRERLFFPKTVLFGLATAVVMATPAEAITFSNSAKDVGANIDGNVPNSTNAITEANNFAGGSYSSLKEFDLNEISLAGTSGGVRNDINPDRATGFNVDLGNTTYTKSGDIFRANSGSQATITFNFNTPVTQFGLFISDYGNSDDSNPIGYEVIDNSGTSITGDIPIPYNTSNNFKDDDGQFLDRRAINFFGATTEAGDNPISKVVLTTNTNDTFNDSFGIDEVRTQPVPFEVETGAGLVLLGGYFGWRRFRRRKQAVASEN